jgi:hypothetical protein
VKRSGTEAERNRSEAEPKRSGTEAERNRVKRSGTEAERNRMEPSGTERNRVKRSGTEWNRMNQPFQHKWTMLDSIYGVKLAERNKLNQVTK